ncbi:MAG: hypothetical protein V3U12_03055 [Nitrosopumilaceae archaeon]|jgi:hypothetical protein
MDESIMISIDLANDVEIAKELQDYLKSKGIDSHLEAAEIKIDKTAFDLKIFKSFLKYTNRTKHSVKKINSKLFLISISVGVEDLGMGTCEICGLVDFEEQLFSHRWTHGI